MAAGQGRGAGVAGRFVRSGSRSLNLRLGYLGIIARLWRRRVARPRNGQVRKEQWPMRVFMLGWEFPPFISGGLGTACYGLTKAMSSLGTDIMFVLPRPVSTPFSTHVRLVSPRAGSALASPTTEFRLDEFDHVTFRTVNANLTPYQSVGAVGERKQVADSTTIRQV